MSVKTKECVHHFLIEPPAGGATSPGVCKKCGLEKDHLNSIPMAQYNSWRGSFKHRKAATKSAKLQ